ncbi:ABC-type sugar transport system, periplasmic component [Sphaerochaeta pleomorpha str. Grapes]|uniref:ABC-type sugar transport system, periplasmic component n=1 Tax=Sphaerochaeta pleomorpha (strain ATCC BAA-1885 / DSM 22778 / Grapes) TaxID=158190 RepID=G8QSC2_SPHPG|nr:ABC transporter substrate-binding protein [Sphaerochaeta pleomorpha]AEV30052.1 ABC-type sugar transport system, periplasmic component [Sphaerochaeta pleomorpha str. Grapes]
MKKKALSLLLVLVMATCLFAGGATETATSDETPITIWAWDPNFNISIMQEAISRYQATHPDAKFQIVEIAKADLEQKLHTTLAAKTKTGLPDIVLIEDYNAQKYLTSYPGQFADLTKSFDYSKFIKSKTDIGVVGGKNYSVPFDSGVTGFFYRTDLLSKAGYSAADLTNITWSRFCEIAADYHKKTGRYLFANGKSDGGLMRVMLQSAGQWYFDKDGKPNLVNNAAIREAVQLYKRFIDEDLAYPTNGWNDWVGALYTSDAASISSGVWIVGSIKAGKDQSGLWAVAPIPRLSGTSSVNASNLGGSSWYILQNGPKRAAAIAFMNEIYGADKEFYQTILLNNGAIGSYTPAFEGDAFAKKDAFFGNYPIYADLSKWAEMIPMVNIGQYTYEADAAIMANMEAYYAGKATLDQTLQAAEAQLKNSIQ